MKSRNLIIALSCLFVVMIIFCIRGESLTKRLQDEPIQDESVTVKSQKPEKQPKFEIIEIGKGAGPRWSPDGARLAFVSGGWLCVTDADGEGAIERIVQRRLWSFDWMSDSAFVASEKKLWAPKGKGRGHKFIIETVDMSGHVEVVAEDSIPGIRRSPYLSYLGAPFVLKDGTVGYYEIHEMLDEETKIFRTIKQGKLKPEEAKKQMRAFEKPYGRGAIWVESLDGTIKKCVSKDVGKWLFPELSPDGKKLFAKNHRAEIIIMDLEGNILANLGRGGCVSWCPDSKRIVFCVQKESEFDIIASELYIINADGTGKIQITDTPNEVETGPVWSPDGTKIACGSHSSGKIFVIKLNEK